MNFHLLVRNHDKDKLEPPLKSNGSLGELTLMVETTTRKRRGFLIRNK